MTRRLTMSVALVAFVAAGCDDDSVTGPEDQLQEVRSATVVYSDLARAGAAGYTVWSPDPTVANSTCASSAEGRMGYHLVNPGLRGSPADPANGDAVIDFRRPEMLLFEKTANGSVRIVGVEYLVFTAAWERVHGAGAAPPTVLGRPLPASRHSFTPGGPEIDHYELHVWVHSDNPNGMFSPWNPAIGC